LYVTKEFKRYLQLGYATSMRLINALNSLKNIETSNIQNRNIYLNLKPNTNNPKNAHQFY